MVKRFPVKNTTRMKTLSTCTQELSRNRMSIIGLKSPKTTGVSRTETDSTNSSKITNSKITWTGKCFMIICPRFTTQVSVSIPIMKVKVKVKVNQKSRKVKSYPMTSRKAAVKPKLKPTATATVKRLRTSNRLLKEESTLTTPIPSLRSKRPNCIFQPCLCKAGKNGFCVKHK